MTTQKNFLVYSKKHLWKIVSVAIFIFVLGTSWLYFQNKDHSIEDTHFAIREEFQRIITQKLLEKNPNATNIRFHELWTESVEDGKKQIKTVFSYSFNDDSSKTPKDNVNVKVSGFALINKGDVNNSKHNWEIGSFEVDQTEMNFSNDEILIIKPDKNTKKKRRENTEDKVNEDNSEIPEEILNNNSYESFDLNDLDFEALEQDDEEESEKLSLEENVTF